MDLKAEFVSQLPPDDRYELAWLKGEILTMASGYKALALTRVRMPSELAATEASKQAAKEIVSVRLEKLVEDIEVHLSLIHIWTQGPSHRQPVLQLVLRKHLCWKPQLLPQIPGFLHSAQQAQYPAQGY